MTQTTFGDVLKAVEQLPIEDQENLILILKKRLRELKRTDLIQDVYSAQQEFEQGKCQPITPEELMEEILS